MDIPMELHIPNFNAAWSCSWLASISTTNGDARGVVAVPARIGDVIEQDNLGRLDNESSVCWANSGNPGTYVAIFVNGITRGKVVIVVHGQVNNLRVTSRAKRLSRDQRRVVDRTRGPLVERRLVGGRGSKRLSKSR